MRARYLVLIAACLLTSNIAAAEEPLFINEKVVKGGYGGAQIKATTLAGDPVMLAGGEAAWILAHSLVLGGGGYGTVTNVTSPGSLQSTTGHAHLGIAYGGLRAATILGNDWRVHGSFGVLFGGGRAWSETNDLGYHRGEGFLVIEPDVEAEANLTRFLRVALGAGYRFVANTEEPGFTPRRLGGPVAVATLRLGEF